MDKRNTKVTKAISWFALMYFVILFAERAQSLIRTFAQDKGFVKAFDVFANITVLLSLCATVIMLAFCNRSFFRSLFKSVVPDWSMLTITCGTALVSGMIHTENTIPGIQFASYGMLIVAMILRTAQLAPNAGNRLSLWYSLAFLTVFSMAIPVVYHSHIELAVLFHIIEFAVMFLLVLSFTLLLRKLFIGKGENLLLLCVVVTMAIGDAIILWMRWSEEVNSFVLIFASLSIVMYIVGKLIFRRISRGRKPVV